MDNIQDPEIINIMALEGPVILVRTNVLVSRSYRHNGTERSSARFIFTHLSPNQCFSNIKDPDLIGINRLVGLVVKASASRAEGPGFESRLRRDFFGVESYQ